MEQRVILTKQFHQAKRAGDHYDWRIVIGDKAYSWATKKGEPPLGGKLVLWEQPVHTRDYALSKKVIIPEGHYGAGETNLVYAASGKAKIDGDSYHLSLNNGDKYFIKKIPKYGDKAWLLVKNAEIDKTEFDKLTSALLLGRPIRESQARKAIAALQSHDLLTPEAISSIPEEKLVDILDEAGYSRFDISTAKKLKYLASLQYPLAGRVKHIGPVTSRIFEELRRRG